MLFCIFVLNVCVVFDLTVSSGSWFQSMVVRGKKEYSNWSVFLGLTWYDLVLSVWCLSTMFVEMKSGKLVALMVLLLPGIGVRYWSAGSAGTSPSTIL